MSIEKLDEVMKKILEGKEFQNFKNELTQTIGKFAAHCLKITSSLKDEKTRGIAGTLCSACIVDTIREAYPITPN